MEFIGVLATMLVVLGSAIALILSIAFAHDRAKSLEVRVKELETMEGVSNEEIERVASALVSGSKEEALAAILALRRN